MTKVELWRPSAERIEASEISQYQAWLQRSYGLTNKSFSELHAWSIADIDAFWES